MTYARVLGMISIAVIAGAFSSASADDLDARLAALERENAALKKQLRIRELENKNAALREQLRSTSPTRPKVDAPARPRPAAKRTVAKRTAAKPEGLAAIASALTYAPLANPPHAAKDSVQLDVHLPSNQWAGWYFGFNGGVGLGSWSLAERTMVEGPLDRARPGSGTSVTGNSRANLKALGATVGVQMGYLWQIGQLVFGPETDISVGEIADRDSQVLTRTTSDVLLYGSPTITYLTQAESSVRWLSSLRGKVGFSRDNWLFFGTGGLAIAGVEILNVNHNLVKSQHPMGYVAGGGLKYAIGPRLSFRTEYLYYRFPETGFTIDLSYDTSPSVTTSTSTTSIKSPLHIIRAGLDVRLN